MAVVARTAGSSQQKLSWMVALALWAARCASWDQMVALALPPCRRPVAILWAKLLLPLWLPHQAQGCFLSVPLLAPWCACHGIIAEALSGPESVAHTVVYLPWALQVFPGPDTMDPNCRGAPALAAAGVPLDAATPAAAALRGLQLLPLRDGSLACFTPWSPKGQHVFLGDDTEQLVLGALGA